MNKIWHIAWSILLTISINQAANATDNLKSIQGLNITNQVECTSKSVRHILHFPQIHVSDKYELFMLSVTDRFQNIWLTSQDLISISQKEIHDVLIQLWSVNEVFEEWITIWILNEMSIDEIRLKGITEAIIWDKSLEKEILKECIEIKAKVKCLSELELIYKQEVKEKKQSADTVLYYKSLWSVKAYQNIIDMMNIDWLMKEELLVYENRLKYEVYEFSKKLRNIIKQGNYQKDEILLAEYPYLWWWTMKLASEWKIKILPWEDDNLNDLAFKLERNIVRNTTKLINKLISLWVDKRDFDYFFKEWEEEKKKAEEVWCLEEYLSFIDSEKKWKKIHEIREDFLVKSIAEYKWKEYIVPAVYWAYHDFTNNVISYNVQNPDNQLCLSKLELKSVNIYEDILK